MTSSPRLFHFSCATLKSWVESGDEAKRTAYEGGTSGATAYELGSQLRIGEFDPLPAFLSLKLNSITPKSTQLLPQKLRRCFTASFRGDVKLSILGDLA